MRPAERVCPFCGQALRADEAPRLGAVVLLGALGAACVLGPSNESASGEASSGGSNETSMSAGTTTSGTSAGMATSTTSTAGPTSTGELTSSNDADSNDSGCAFYGGCPTDVGPGPNECSQWVQDCPDGEKCMPADSDGFGSWDALKCVPVARGAGKPGEPCTVEGSGDSGIDDCERGAMCWDVDADTDQGTCVALCTGTPDQPVCAEPGTACFDAINGIVTVCLPTCDPLAKDCPDGETCVPGIPDPNDFVCVFEASGEKGQEFDGCEFVNECDPGLMCANPALATECDENVWGCCLAFCDLTMPSCNGAGAQCLPWLEDGQGPPELQKLGVCGIPE